LGGGKKILGPSLGAVGRRKKRMGRKLKYGPSLGAVGGNKICALGFLFFL